MTGHAAIAPEDPTPPDGIPTPPAGVPAAADDRTFIIVFQDLYRGQLVTFTRLTLVECDHHRHGANA